MTAEVPAGAASLEDVAELRRLLAVAQQTAKTSINRANSEAGQVSRWKARRDDLAASVREALGMGPAPEHIHVKPIVDRIGELCSDRDEAVALTDGLRTRLQVARDALEAERERSAALAKAVRAAQAKVNANARRVRTLETSRADVVKATAEAEAERVHAAQQRDRAVQAEAQVAELRAQAAELRARVAELEREARARPEPSPVRPASIGVLSEVEQLAAADRITRAPRVVSALRGADVAALLRSGSPVAVALGRVSLGGAGELMDRAALVLGLATAWAKGVR
jgi:DNA repair exonuclease SbcCD ATPase subunit